ncbi:sigma-54-dependent Fis family transcriptional regulator [Kaistia algarum]|uniref:sigma-54-dependent transcriptional regulator n=1 Tax=Kaistia algarum TaxID=2083279 RepID=UPI000CE86485|nr:sigma-54 dependent transcriptional regulator [Kaistia algarum]MCX5512465.1 sigma-54 dependent transcriptional regulator [Kaistia algarum]PPE80543.1 sigma-54-dependent Fis family transcriptional regulator [Kaistia algarum]
MGFADGSNNEPVQILIIDSDPVQRRLVSAHLAAGAGPAVQTLAVASRDEAVHKLSGHRPSLILADVETLGGVEALGNLVGAHTRVIATSARGSVHSAVAAIRAGAVDYLPKPFGAAALIERVEAAIVQWNKLGSEPGKITNKLPHPPTAKADPAGFEGFVGLSAPMRAIFDQVERIAPSRAPVFITGESGTGKELCAEAIHSRSGRGGKPFIAINCGAIPKDLMESEIFGHVRGAFTGASDTRPGAAELADGGTLFLDEIGEMELGLQAKLLRFLQSGTVQRVGETTARRVDVRIVSATNRDPFAEIATGRFREDLFYRLHVLPIHMPPLRERADDILLLAETFLARFADEERRDFIGFSDEAASLLMRHAWPGNVRELQNAIRRMVVLNRGTEITAAMLPATIGGVPSVPRQAGPSSRMPDPIVPFWEQERSIIESAVGAFSGNIARAAAALEISPSTIYRKRQAWLEKRSA